MDFTELQKMGAELVKLIADHKANIEAAKGVLAANDLATLRDQLRGIHEKAMEASDDLDAALAEVEKRG